MHTIGGADLLMANFKLGQFVSKDKGGTAIVRAIFTTKEGELMYAVERDGVLDFIPERRLLAPTSSELVA
jgi:hypothetical protein